MHLKDKVRNQYTWMIFRPLFISACAVVLIINVVVFVVITEEQFSENQNSLKAIASSVAENIPIDIHEQLQTTEQQSTDQYKKIETYFQSVLTANPKLDDIYTLRPTGEPHQFTFVVSGQETRDRNHNGTIDAFEYKANFGDTYDATDAPDLELGLSQISADRKITYDKWGAWLSGYAPLIDQSGKSVAVVGVDLSANYINADRLNLAKEFLLVDAILLLILLIITYYLSRHFGKSMSKIADAMVRVSHGDLTYRMPFHGHNADGHMAELFNGMVAHFSDHIKHSEGEEKESPDDKE